MARTNTRALARTRRKKHIRRTIRGTTERPRLCVFRSAKHMYAQVIDDVKGTTVVSSSTQAKDLTVDGHRGNIAAAKAVGAEIARRAKEAGVTSVVFDRNGFLYHGRVKALADAAREAGLEF